MKLGIIAQPNEESFIMAKNKNLDFIELCVNVTADVDEFISQVDKIKEWINEYGVQIGSIGRWGVTRIDEEGNICEEALQREYQLIDVCANVNCGVYVCGCNEQENLSFLENCQAAIRFFEKLLTYGKERGVKIAIYNCRWNNFVHSENTWNIIHGELKELGIKYDASHSYYAGNDNYLSEIAKWGDRFYHFHIKGALKVDGKRYDDPPAGMDQLDWQSIMAILYKVGYNGNLSIEPHSSTWNGELGDKGVDFTIKYMQDFILQ